MVRQTSPDLKTATTPNSAQPNAGAEAQAGRNAMTARNGAAIPPIPIGSGLQITDGGDDLTLWQREMN
eukprot:659736-Amphidinium_carterae.1